MNLGSNQQAIFVYLNRWREESVSNIVISEIYRQLWSIKSCVYHEASRAENLILQADNSVPENKNRYILGCFSVLVSMGWYKRMYMYYMVPGHTHSIIDSSPFKLLNAIMHKDELLTAADILSNIPTKHFKTNPPQMVYLYDIYDWKRWLYPHLAQLFYHTEPHAFLIAYEEDKEKFICCRCSSNIVSPAPNVPSHNQVMRCDVV